MRNKVVLFGILTLFVVSAVIPVSAYQSWTDPNGVTWSDSPSAATDAWPFPSIEWSFDPSDLPSRYLPSSNQVMMTPIVADVTGPGNVPDGIPDIIFTTFDPDLTPGEYCRHGIIRVISGNGGGHHYSITGTTHAVIPIGSIAVADIDNDKLPEIIAITDDQGISGCNRVICFEGETGNFKWWSSQCLPSTSGCGTGCGGPAIADIDQDGEPEIIVGNYVFRSDGSFWWMAGGGTGRYLSCVADLNGDGTPEVISGNCAHSGGPFWWCNNNLPDGFNAIADFDLDGNPEVVLVGWDKDNSGTRVWVLNRLNGNILCKSEVISTSAKHPGGAPCIADVDGDGCPEIGVAVTDKYVVLEVAPGSPWTCTIKWDVTIQDGSSGIASSSAFDFNQDGKYDIVYSDEYKLFVFDDAIPGHVRFDAPCPSYTACEMPVIADVDNDRHAEIVVPLNNYMRPGNTGIEVWGNNDWPQARRIWNQHTYHITNVNEDATVPRFETNNWILFNNYRVQAEFGCKFIAHFMTPEGEPYPFDVILSDGTWRKEWENVTYIETEVPLNFTFTILGRTPVNGIPCRLTSEFHFSEGEVRDFEFYAIDWEYCEPRTTPYIAFQEVGADASLSWNWNSNNLTLDWNLTCNPDKYVGVSIGIDDNMSETPNYGVLHYYGEPEFLTIFPIHFPPGECVISANLFVVIETGSQSNKIVFEEIDPALGTITIGNALYNDAIIPLLNITLKDLNGTEYAPQYLIPQYAVPPGNYILEVSYIPIEIGAQPPVNRIPSVCKSGKGVLFDIFPPKIADLEPFTFSIFAESAFAHSSYSNLIHVSGDSITVDVSTETDYDWWGYFVLPDTVTVAASRSYDGLVWHDLDELYDYTINPVDGYNIVVVRISPETERLMLLWTPDWNPWDDDCVIKDAEISLAEYHWATNTPINGHIITDAEISLLEYQWATGDVC